MSRLQQWIASCLGIGSIKGGGTIAALIACLAWYLLQRDGSFHTSMIGVTAIILVLGTWSATGVDAVWGKDSSRVVIDEVAGMFVGLLFIPVTWQYLLAGWILFRFFDILKPLYIKRLEALPKGWGVMADDVLAGIYTNILLQLGVYFIAK